MRSDSLKSFRARAAVRSRESTHRLASHRCRFLLFPMPLHRRSALRRSRGTARKPQGRDSLLRLDAAIFADRATRRSSSAYSGRPTALRRPHRMIRRPSTSAATPYQSSSVWCVSSSPLSCPVHRRTIMRLQHVEAQHFARPIASNSLIVTKLPIDFDIFVAFDLQEAVVHPIIRHRSTCRARSATARVRSRGAERSGRDRRHGCRTPRRDTAALIAEHSMCQPGRPLPHGLSQPGSSPDDCFHSTKSVGRLLVGVDRDARAGAAARRACGPTARHSPASTAVSNSTSPPAS